MPCLSGFERYSRWVPLISLWLTKVYHCLHIRSPSEKEWNGSCRYFTDRVCSDDRGICSYLQSCQMSSESNIQSKSAIKSTNKRGTQTRKSAYNALFLYVVLLACYLSFLLSAKLYLTNTSEISFLVAKCASLFLICLNSSLNPIVYCWRYREIRQIIKSTMKRILRMDENMTWGCEVLRDKIWWERAIREGNWDELTFAKTSGNVTRDKWKMTKNDCADRRVPTWATVPETISGNISSLIVSNVANGLTVPKDQRKV